MENIILSRGVISLKINWHLSLALVCVVLGVLLATSFNTQQRNEEALNSTRKKNLIETIHELEKSRGKLESEIKGERAQIAKYEELAAKNQGILTSYTKELNKVKTAAGLVQAKGRGLAVTLADNPQYPKDDPNPNNYVIHDYDIRLIVNTLWVGGAQAISVNNQRLISTSSIRCAGDFILINSTRLSSPYTIKAIGNPDKLKSALNEDASSRQFLNDVAKFYGLKVSIDQENNMSINGYNGGLLIDKASVVGGGK